MLRFSHACLTTNHDLAWILSVNRITTHTLDMRSILDVSSGFRMQRYVPEHHVCSRPLLRRRTDATAKRGLLSELNAMDMLAANDPMDLAHLADVDDALDPELLALVVAQLAKPDSRREPVVINIIRPLGHWAPGQ